MILSRCDKGNSIVRLASVLVEITCFYRPVSVDGGFMMISRHEGPHLGPPTTLYTEHSTFPWKLHLSASVYQISPLRGPRGTRPGTGFLCPTITVPQVHLHPRTYKCNIKAGWLSSAMHHHGTMLSLFSWTLGLCLTTCRVLHDPPSTRCRVRWIYTLYICPLCLPPLLYICPLCLPPLQATN